MVHRVISLRCAMGEQRTMLGLAGHPRVRDDRDPPLVTGETRGVKSLICLTGCFVAELVLALARLSPVNPGRAEHEPGIDFTTELAAQWILRCAIAHHSSRQEARPGMTKSGSKSLRSQ